MSSPTVAILVRTKDRPRFLSRALENIAQQTFTDYTVCVINDGGDEQATRAVIEASPLGLLGSNAQDSSRVQLLTTVGDNMEAASNAGLAATTSEYVAIHDDDDLWAPEFLERTVAALEESGAIGGGYSARGVHGAHGAEETHPVTVEPESSDEAPAQPHPTRPGLLARVARRLRG